MLYRVSGRAASTGRGRVARCGRLTDPSLGSTPTRSLCVDLA